MGSVVPHIARYRDGRSLLAWAEPADGEVVPAFSYAATAAALMQRVANGDPEAARIFGERRSEIAVALVQSRSLLDVTGGLRVDVRGAGSLVGLRLATQVVDRSIVPSLRGCWINSKALGKVFSLGPPSLAPGQYLYSDALSRQTAPKIEERIISDLQFYIKREVLLDETAPDLSLDELLLHAHARIVALDSGKQYGSLSTADASNLHRAALRLHGAGQLSVLLQQQYGSVLTETRGCAAQYKPAAVDSAPLEQLPFPPQRIVVRQVEDADRVAAQLTTPRAPHKSTPNHHPQDDRSPSERFKSLFGAGVLALRQCTEAHGQAISTAESLVRADKAALEQFFEAAGSPQYFRDSYHRLVRFWAWRYNTALVADKPGAPLATTVGWLPRNVQVSLEGDRREVVLQWLAARIRTRAQNPVIVREALKTRDGAGLYRRKQQGAIYRRACEFFATYGVTLDLTTNRIYDPELGQIADRLGVQGTPVVMPPIAPYMFSLGLAILENPGDMQEEAWVRLQRFARRRYNGSGNAEGLEVDKVLIACVAADAHGIDNLPEEIQTALARSILADVKLRPSQLKEEDLSEDVQRRLKHIRDLAKGKTQTA